MGDCALVPNAFDGKPSPTLAQFAVRQARQLAHNVLQQIAGKPTRPFQFRPLGSFAAIGRRNAVGLVLGLKFSGFFAWTLWRGIYLSKMPTTARKIEIAFDWAWDLLFPREICEINPRESPRIPRSHFQSGDQILKPGDNPDKFFVIEKGTASVIAEGDGDPVLHLGPGEFFAENELARAGDRRFSMRADGPLDVLTIEHGPFQDFLRHLHQLRTASNDRIKRLDALSELREVVRKHPGLGHASAGDAMPKQLPTLGVSASFASAISHFQQEKRTAFVVVDDRGRLQGICTVTDLHNARCAPAFA